VDFPELSGVGCDGDTVSLLNESIVEKVLASPQRGRVILHVHVMDFL